MKKIRAMIKSKLCAFTLAETLITLMIIGVVAALTIPTLMQTWQDRQYETAKKKAMTTIANGYKLMIAENDGNTSGLDLLTCGDDFSCLSSNHRKHFSIAADKSKTHDGLPEKYTKSGDSSEEAGFVWDDVPYIFTTSDGMTYGYLGGFDVVVDVNGSKSPNKICKDTFKLSFSGNTIKDTALKEGVETPLCEDLDNSGDACNSFWVSAGFSYDYGNGRWGDAFTFSGSEEDFANCSAEFEDTYQLCFTLTGHDYSKCEYMKNVAIYTEDYDKPTLACECNDE